MLFLPLSDLQWLQHPTQGDFLKGCWAPMPLFKSGKVRNFFQGCLGSNAQERISFSRALWGDKIEEKFAKEYLEGPETEIEREREGG